MSRYRYRVGVPYPGRLTRVTQRPIENGPESGILLVRMEFEIFVVDDERGYLRSTGKIASRDLVVGELADSGIEVYCRALQVGNPRCLDDWTHESLLGRWVKIQFAALDPVDYRNPFASIHRLDPPSTEVVEYDYQLDRDWFTVSEVADDLGCSPATIRRKIELLEPAWGTQLIRRTEGGHRRICLPLLRNLL